MFKDVVVNNLRLKMLQILCIFIFRVLLTSVIYPSVVPYTP
jgi:hypothetical protein